MTRCTAIVLCLVVTGSVSAGEKLNSWWEYLCPIRLRLDRCCPDDYCRKVQPCLPPGYCPCGRDDYCGKTMPYLPPEYRPCGCDSYDAKPTPKLPCPSPWMKCYPTDGCAPQACSWWSFPWWGPRLCGR